MYSKASIIAASALVAQVSAVGNAIIHNGCANDVYVWTVSQYSGDMQTIAPGDKLVQSYITNPNGGGVSMKIATEPDQAGPITQFEYTLTSDLWYDISNINGFPFMDSGLTLIPSTTSCRSMVCPAGVAICTAAYNVPDDNQATAMCDTGSDMTLLLCSGQNGSDPVADASSAANVVASSAAPAPVSSAAPVANNIAVVVSSSAPVSSAAPAPAPAPVTTAAPSPPSVPIGGGGNVFTTFVTQIVTVIAERAAAPSADVQKRAIHQHHHHMHAADAN